MPNIFETVTAQIIAAIEAGAADFQMPWTRAAGSFALPVNGVSGHHYRGINIVLLWAAAQAGGLSSARWATYRQWSSIGAQVRKGERATTVLLWKPRDARDDNQSDADARSPSFIARSFHVFNADQVDGLSSTPDAVIATSVERISRAEGFFARLPSTVREEGDRAYYAPSVDEIFIPPIERFQRAESFYSVLAHEHVHWTGAKSRLDRDLSSRFGSEAYAMEELIAELGAAFLMAQLSLATEPRRDHAPYIANWLRVLRDDTRAIVFAASRAQAAVDLLIEQSSLREQVAA